MASEVFSNTFFVMVYIFVSQLLLLCIISQFLQIQEGTQTQVKGGNWLPLESVNKIKLQFEKWALLYTAIWIALFGCVVIFQIYEKFDENGYLVLCVSLALPLLLQPFFFPLSAEKNFPFWLRYSFKANLWIAIFSFIGNYWYTHYFYSVLKAKYTFPAHRLNDVPISLYFATHFYFVTYHTFSNMILRKIESRYKPSWLRSVFFWACVLAFSYFTAFMETLTISSFPYYSFENRDLAYTLGSAFYSIYFIVSFPVFYRLDEKVSLSKAKAKGMGVVKPHDLFQTVFEVMGVGMVVLLLLDLCRLACGIDLTIAGKLWYIYRSV